MIITGIVIVIATFIAIIKQYETRLVLFLSGIIMCSIGGNPGLGATAFINEFTNAGLVPTICTVLGFSYVMEHIQCSKHMVYMCTNALKKHRIILIPGTVILTFLLNIALPSAAGCAAAVGTLLIPVLIRSRVHPAMAASALFLGTWGSVMSPGLMFNPQVAQLAGTDVLTVISTFYLQVIAAEITAAIILTALAYYYKENKVPENVICTKESEKEDFNINYIYAVIPIIPLLLLIISSKQIGLLPPISVPNAMLIGVGLGMLVVRPNLKETTKKFFCGAGDGMCDVVGLIAGAACFTAGMNCIGLTSAMISAMETSQAIAKVTSAFCPFIIAVISGSGNAAALAFNGAVTPHAADFGYGIIELGSMAQIGAAIGRCISPVAGAGIIIAKLAGIQPIEMTKRNFVPCVIATIIVMTTLL